MTGAYVGYNWFEGMVVSSSVPLKAAIYQLFQKRI